MCMYSYKQQTTTRYGHKQSHSIYCVIPRQADTTQFLFPPVPLSSPILVSKHKILPHDTSNMPELHRAGETEKIFQIHPLGQFSALLPSA